jgi:HEAT repeat protein
LRERPRPRAKFPAVFAPPPLPRNLEASFRDLASDKPAVRAAAIRDVVSHSLRSDATRARAVPALERALKGDADPRVRAAAAVGLADVGASEALPGLLVAVEDDDAGVRQMALTALGEIGDARAAQRLERALRDERPEVRYQAVIAYARVAADDAPAVAAALAHALDDGDPAVRYIAMRVAEEHQTDGRAVRDDALTSRADGLLRSDDLAVAVVAALYLAPLAHAEARAVVLDVVADRRRTPELEDEQACIELAGRLGFRDAIPSLERRVWGARRAVRSLLSWGAGAGERCAWHARIALARMGHARARAEILADLGSWRRGTREAAVVSAGLARLAEARDVMQGLGGSVDAALLDEALGALAEPALAGVPADAH